MHPSTDVAMVMFATPMGAPAKHKVPGQSRAKAARKMRTRAMSFFLTAAITQWSPVGITAESIDSGRPFWSEIPAARNYTRHSMSGAGCPGDFLFAGAPCPGSPWTGLGPWGREESKDLRLPLGRRANTPGHSVRIAGDPGATRKLRSHARPEATSIRLRGVNPQRDQAG
jgi:hypothetical protein